MLRIPAITVMCVMSAVSCVQAETTTLCTVVRDVESGDFLKQEGVCDQRMSPASTFKIAISLMGFDAGILTDESAPALPFREGYPDWNPAWRTTTTPASWMRDSVVWYSQQITQSLGEERFRDYVAAFDYGNEDVSGDPGKENGLMQAWIGSSLAISPLEQVEFLGKIVAHDLPLGAHAYDMTALIMDVGVQPSGWHVYGKTGAAAPRTADGALDREHAFGWFVGWAENNARTVVFARLVQNSERTSVPPGLLAKEAVLNELFSDPDAL